ncbi:unnamed protein product [Heterobilharzia americana]|nr:unnamed protein product [Heterobilharzia americana]
MENWKCPDWKKYTLDHPSLKEYVEKLNKLGLKDPWIRNYAWVYSSRVYRTRSQHLKLMFLSQLPVGIVLGVVASLMVNAFDRWRKRQFQLASH